jgi:hypothetical protein
MRRLVAAGATAVLALSMAAPAHAAPSPSPTPSPLSGEATLSVSALANGVVRPGQHLSVSATLDNGTRATLPDTEIRVELGTDALPDRAALAAWLDDGAGGGFASIGSVSAPSLPSGEDVTSGLDVPPDNPALAGRAPGVYALRATATAGGETIASRSVVVVPDDAVAAPVGIVVPITAPPGTAGLLSTDDLTALTAADGALTAQLDAVDGTAAILAVDPAIPAAIRARGTAAPQTAVEWLERLEELPNSRFALQYGDADLATQVHAGLTSPLLPTSLISYLSMDDLPAPQTPTPTPSPSDTAPPETPAIPDVAQLTGIGNAAQAGVYWPGTGTAGADVIAALGAASTGGAPSLSLVPSATTAAAGGAPVTRARATAGDAQLLVYDSAASAALHRAAGELVPARRGAPLAEATAHLAFAARESGGHPVLVTVDRDIDRERVGLRAAITAAALAPGMRATDLAEVAAGEPVAATVADIPADGARVGDLTQLLADEATIGEFATILEDPALLTGRERAEILQLLAVSWSDDPEAAAAAMAGHRDQTRATLDAVGILPSSVLNLIAYDANFGLWVRNDLPYPAHLSLVAQPDDPRLVVEQRTEVVASADSNTRVTVPVQARIGNGAVTVTMQLYSPTGVPIGAVQSADVEVRAEWETIGLVVLVILMVLFLGLGIIRTVLRRRARAREAAAASLEPAVRSDEPNAGGRA